MFHDLRELLPDVTDLCSRDDLYDGLEYVELDLEDLTLAALVLVIELSRSLELVYVLLLPVVLAETVEVAFRDPFLL